MSNPLPNNLALSVINTNDPINSAPLRNDFASVQTAVNQLIACLSGGTSGQIFSAVDGTDVQWINQIRYRKTSAKQVVNTVTETDLLNGEISVGAGVLGTNGVLRLTAWGDLVNNTGAAVGLPRFKLKLGPTTIFDTNTVATAWNTSGSRQSWRAVAEIANLGATNAQWASIVLEAAGFFSSTAAAAFTTGEGTTQGFGNTAMLRAQGGNSGAIDTTVAQTLALTVTLATANANEDVTLKGALVETI